MYGTRIIILFILLCISCTQYQKREASNVEIEFLGFKKADVHTESHFRGISVVDSLVVWVSGSKGTYLRTVDGGKSWKVDSVPEYSEYDFRDVEAFDAQTALLMAAGRPAVILKTIDGGENWTKGYYDNRDGIFLNAMAFWDRAEGIAVGDPIDGRFLLLTTQNGGESWTEMIPESRPEAFEGEYQFAASGTAINVARKKHAWFGTGGSKARIFYSKDKGKTWNGSEALIMSGTPSSGVFSLFFTGNKNGWAVGGDYTREDSIDLNSIVTLDGGNTWQLSSDLPSGFRSCVLQLKPAGTKVLICTGPSGTDYSLDQGNSWIHMESPGYHTMDVGKYGMTVWAAGGNGRVGKLEYRVQR